MQNLHLSWTALGLATSLLFGVSACQPQSAAPPTSAKTDTVENSIQEPIKKTSSKPAAVSASASAIDAKTCLALSDAMQAVNNESKIEAIYNIQKTLKACLPTTHNDEALNFLKAYEAMYSRFLWSDDALNGEASDQAFFTVMSALEQNEEISAASLKKLPARVRYLVELVQNDADVSVYNLGEGYYDFTHDLTAMVDIFAPYLRQDQRAFVQRMATDNQESFWSDAAVTVTFGELIDRAVFWEDYIKRHPNGYAVADAKSLLDFYRYIIFFGSDNTEWTDDMVREFIEPQDRQMMVKLARRPNSLLAKDAQNFLNFLVLSDSERQEKYPAPLIDDNGYEMTEWTIANYQLDKAMDIPSIWEDGHSNHRQCLDGVFCQDIVGSI